MWTAMLTVKYGYLSKTEGLGVVAIRGSLNVRASCNFELRWRTLGPEHRKPGLDPLPKIFAEKVIFGGGYLLASLAARNKIGQNSPWRRSSSVTQSAALPRSRLATENIDSIFSANLFGKGSMRGWESGRMRSENRLNPESPGVRLRESSFLSTAVSGTGTNIARISGCPRRGGSGGAGKSKGIAPATQARISHSLSSRDAARTRPGEARPGFSEGLYEHILPEGNPGWNEVGVRRSKSEQKGNEKCGLRSRRKFVRSAGTSSRSGPAR
jgi:hypothetical protein